MNRTAKGQRKQQTGDNSTSSVEAGSTEEGTKLEQTSRSNHGLDTAKRPKRVPLHRQNIIHADTKAGFVRRMVNDTDDRIERFKKAGWTEVENAQIGDPHAGDPSSLGSASVKSVGAGMKAILMEIPEEFYQEDQKDKGKKVDTLEEAMEHDIKSKLGDSAIGEGIKIKRE
jgi:hypothetical protein